MKYSLNVNGKAQAVDVPERMPLLWVLRDTLGLKGTKFGCGQAQCGACTVLLDGQATRSCVTQVSAVGTKKVTTIESLPADGSHPLQKAWLELDVPQCGYCQAGQLMAASALLTTTPKPTDAQNRCRDVPESLSLWDLPADQGRHQDGGKRREGVSHARHAENQEGQSPSVPAGRRCRGRRLDHRTLRAEDRRSGRPRR